MRTILLASGAALGLAFSLACGGGGGGMGGSFDNVGACKAYVEHFNSLECTSSINFDPNEYCPDALDLNPTDMTPFYECLSSNAKCDGTIPDLAGQADCSM
ncbi:MAG: hypothetical protein EP330_21395 [Deltaproteobacteria bacterium]|nr:MAG: hypothetical protein EP330_21395 [Deltaproteobacteria bacterium]